jgi:hypothetical protein
LFTRPQIAIEAAALHGMLLGMDMLTDISASCGPVTAPHGNRPFVLGGDGRGAWVRRWKDLVELHSDLGGPAACSEAQLSLCRRIATTEVELERLEARMSEGDDTVDLDVFNRLAGNLRRMFESIGLERRARPVNAPLTLAEISGAHKGRAGLAHDEINQGNQIMARGGKRLGAGRRPGSASKETSKNNCVIFGARVIEG